jgi:glycosyltransferase involved in cell wall biosynthesis
MKQDCPKVSIGLVVYNQEAFIEDCLDSIRAQTYPNIELLISDDCSPDSTRDILKKYQERHPDFITQLLLPPQNLGVAKNLNFVVSHLTGDYITLFSGDDLMLSEKIEKQVRQMEEKPEAGMCYTNMKWFNPEKGATWFNHFGILQKRPKCFGDLIKDNTLPSPTFFYRKNAMPKNGYDESVSVMSDYKIAIDVYEKHPITYIPEVLTKYCKHSNSITAQSFYSRERRIFHKMLQDRFKGQYDHELKYNLALCRYALIMDNVKRGNTKRPLRLLRAILPYGLTSVKWFLRIVMVLRSIILCRLQRR